MSDKDIVIQSAFRVPDGSQINSKPCYLLVLSNPNGKGTKQFIALELPALEASWLKAKGLFVEATEDHIVENYVDLLKSLTAEKKNIVEMYFPWHSVNYMRSLVYNANKSK
jgi:hypothetical protein